MQTALVRGGGCSAPCTDSVRFWGRLPLRGYLRFKCRIYGYAEPKRH